MGMGVRGHTKITSMKPQRQWWGRPKQRASRQVHHLAEQAWCDVVERERRERGAWAVKGESLVRKAAKAVIV